MAQGSELQSLQPLFQMVNKIDIFISLRFFFGRYGDALNPWGDLITMGRAWCVAKPGALALMGVPTAKVDKIVFNGARVYGKLLFSHLYANWEQVYTETNFDLEPECKYCYQPLIVLKKPESSKQEN